MILFSLSKGVVSEREFVDFVITKFQEEESPKKQKVPIPKKTERMVFSVMPFSDEYEDVYFLAMRKAAKYVKAKCHRVDEQDFVGDIVEKIKKKIKVCVRNYTKLRSYLLLHKKFEPCPRNQYYRG